MKKNLTRIFATASAVVAIVFVIVLLVAVFGGIGDEDFDNSLVKGLFVALGIIFVLLTAVTLALLFINDELVKEISLSSGKDGGTTITVSDVKKKTKQTILAVGGMKCTKCVVVDNEYGVRLKITLKVKDKDISDIDNYVRATLEDEFAGAYNGFHFHSIEIKVKKLESKYKTDPNRIKRSIDDARRAEAAAKEASEPAAEEPVAEPVEESEPAEGEPAVENDTEAVAEENTEETETVEPVEETEPVAEEPAAEPNEEPEPVEDTANEEETLADEE